MVEDPLGRGEVWNPLAISHTPMNTSHSAPGMACIELSWNPRISNTYPQSRTAYPARHHPARKRGTSWLRQNAEHRMIPATPTAVMPNS